MASQIRPRVCRTLPKLFLHGQTWRLPAKTQLWQRPSPASALSVSSSVSTDVAAARIHTSAVQQMGLVNSVKNKLGIKQYRYNRYLLDDCSVRLYICLAEQIDLEIFFKELEMEDSFNSWFRVMELHVWLLLARLAEEGHDGKRMSNNVVASLWRDMDKRARKMGKEVSSVQRKEATEALFSEFKLSLISYDEGMLSDDKVLAGAVWRTFYQKDIVKPQQLETLVAYIRKQLLHLHNQEASTILSVGVVSLLPLYGDEEDVDKKKELFNDIITRTNT